MQERSQLESAAAARLEAAEATAAAKAEALRNKMEGRIAAIAARLGQLAAQASPRCLRASSWFVPFQDGRISKSNGRSDWPAACDLG